jgi:general secretion pathway protein D
MKLSLRHQGVPILFAMLLASCATAPWPSSAVPGNTPEARVANAQEALVEQPEKIPARKDVRLTIEQAVAELLAQAETAKASGRLEEAMQYYARVLALEPANLRAQTGRDALERDRRHAVQVRDARDFLKEGKGETAELLLRKVLLENPHNTEAMQLEKEARLVRRGPDQAPPRLKPPFEKPVTLELRDANIKMVFEALSRATGINFILDKDIRPDTRATVFIKQARIEDAIEMVLATNGLQKKVLSETNALIYPNTVVKLKDYEDLVIRSFYFTNAKAKEVSAMIKTVLKARDIFVDERLNMLVMRDTPQVIRAAEKLVAGNDLPDPEVMLEIEVLEVNRGRLQELGLQYPNQLTVLGNEDGIVTLDTLRNLNSGDIRVSPAPSLRFRKELSDSNLLANPRIRVRNNEKAKVQVGDRVPVVTTIATANVGSSESVSYVDVGLKLEVEPRIALDDYVHIKVGLEVSSLGERTLLNNGSFVYQIGTRNANTLLRLKDGETQVLAGLISDGDRKSANRVPGLGDIPIIGRLFSVQTDERAKTEIVLAITPRIVGNISRPEAEVVEYWSGTASGISDVPLINVPATGGAVAPAPARVPSGREQTDDTPDEEEEMQPSQPQPLVPAQPPLPSPPAAPAPMS